MKSSMHRKKLLTSMFVILGLGFVTNAFGQASFSSVKDGNWNDGTVWTYTGIDGDGIPDADDDVTINSKDDITLIRNESCASLTLNGGSGAGNAATITIANFALTVAGNISNAGTNSITVSTGALNIGGAFASGTAFTAGTGTVNYNGTGAQTVSVYSYNNLTISGARTTNSITLASGTINVAGNYTATATFTTGGYIVSGNTVTLNGTAQAVSGTPTFNDLNFSGATNFGASVVTVAGNLNSSAGSMTTVDPSSFTFTGNSSGIGGSTVKNFYNFIIKAGATCTASTGNVQVSKSFTNDGTFDQTSGFINFRNSVIITLAGSSTSTTFYNLNIEGINTVLNAGTLDFTVKAGFNVVASSGIFNGGSKTVTFSGSAPSFSSGAGTINFNNVNIIDALSTLSNTANSKSFNVAGNWINNGTYKAGTETITFNRTDADQTIGGTSTTTFNKIQVSKGSANRVLEATSVIGMAPGGLTLTSGTFKISSASSVIASTNTNFTLGSTSGIHLNNAAALFNIGGNGGSATVDGAITLSNGTINIGGSNNSLILGSTGIYNQMGGTANIKGRLQATTSGGSFTLSNGNFNILSGGTVSTGSNSIFYVANASLSITGGTVSIASPNQNLALADITIDKTGIPITGGKFLITTGNTGSVKTITVNSNVPFYNFEVQQGTDVLTAKLISNNLQVSNDLTITSGTLDANGKDVLVKGNWTNNGGTFTPGTGTVSFTNTSADQTIGGTATLQTFNSITVAKGANKLIIGGSTTTATVGGTLTMTSGNIDCGTATLELGTSAASVGTLSYTAGNIIGNFKRWINAASPTQWLFPVGTATANRKALVIFTNLTNGSLTAKFNEFDPGAMGLPLIENSLSVSNQFTEGYWSLIAANSLASTNYALELSGTGFSRYTIDGNTRIIKRPSGGSWLLDGSHVTAVSPTAKRSGLSGFSEFALATTTTVASQCPSTTVVTSSADQMLCQGATANQLTATVTTAGSSGTPTLQYQWYYNTANNTSGATKIVGATSATYTPLTTAAETGTRYYFAVGYATDNGCGQTDATFSLASNLIKVTVGAASVGGTASPDQTICSGSTAADLILSGHTGSVIKWQRSTTNDFSAGVTDIANTTTTLTGASIGSLTTTTYFRAVVQNGGCAEAYSAAAAITVKPLPTATISGDATVCLNASQPDITFTGADGTAPYTFTYKLNSGSPQTIQTASGNNVTLAVPTTAAGTFAYELVSVQDAAPNACGNTSGGTATVTVQAIAATPAVNSPINAGATTISGTNSAMGSTQIEVYVNGSLVGTTSATTTWTLNGVSPLTAGNSITAKAVVPGQCTSAASAPVVVSAVTSAPMVNAPLCEGATVISGTSSEADGTVITVFVNNVSAGTTNVGGGTWTKTTASLSAGASVTATATASGATESSTSAAVVVQANGTLMLTSGTGTDAQTVCINSPIAKIFYMLGGSATGYSISGLPAGLTYSLSSGTITIQGTPTVAGSFNYTVTATGSACANPTATGNLTVNASLPVSVTIAANPGIAICAGTPVTFTATPANGGNASSYQWKVNNVNAGTDQATFTSSTLANGDKVTAVVMSNAPCASGSPATSNELILTVNPTPTLTGVAQAAPVCAGTSATINLTGLIANSTATVSYSINGVAQPAVPNVTANGTGAGNFATASLTAANNGQTLQITGITITSATPGCSASFTQNATLSVSTCSVPTDYYVNDNSTSGDALTGSVGNDGNPGTQALPFATIGHAIAVAPAGATIFVDAGAYNESVVVNKALTIKGKQAGVLAKGRSGAESVLDPNSLTANGFKIVTDNVTIDGFTITNSAAYPSGNPIPERSGVVTIEKAGAGNFTGIVVKNNVITRQFKAVNFNATDNFEISGNWLHGESDAYNYGCIWVSSYGTSSTTGLITNNDLDGYSSAVEVQGNATQSVSNLTVSENRSTGSQYVLFGLQNSTVTRNTVLNVTTGSHVYIGGGCTASTFSQNFFDGGTSSGIRIENVYGAGLNANLTVTNNSITGHNAAGKYEINVDAAGYTGSLAATCNWFGTTDNAAVAAKVNGPVTYAPYLTSGADYDLTTAGFQPVPGSCNSNQTEFYVDDNSNTGDVYTTTATGNDMTGNGTQTAPYATIAKAISVAPAGATIYVDAGSYAENVNVNKSLTILGSNAGINPNTGTRNAEAIVVPATNNVASGRIFDVNADNVTIKGFTLDGDNTAVSGGYAANGADNNAAFGIACGNDPSVDGFNALLVENNIIKNIGANSGFSAAFYGSGSQTAARTGSNFQNNKIDNSVLWGVVTESNFYTNVQNNVITRTGRGIQFDNTWIAGVPVTIANNNVKYYRRGILVNLRYGTATPVAVSGNTIQTETSGNGEDGMPSAAAVNRGLLIWSIAATAGNVTLTDNNVSNAWYGEELWNNAPGKVSQTGGVLSNNQYGIYLPTNQDAYGNAAYGSNASITRVTINNSVADGVWLNDNNSADLNSINLSLTNAFITGGANSVRVTGNDVAATVNNNSLTGSSAKAIDAGAFTNATPINATCNWYGDAGYATVTLKVSGNVTYQPYLTSGTDIDAATPGFQPMANACNSGVQFYVNDASTANGMYTTTAGNDANPGTPSQPFATIGHAVLVAPAGATIYVDAGTYQEQVIINKSLDIVGAGRSGGSITKILSPGTLAAQTSGSGTGHRPIVMAKGEGNTVDIKKVLIDGAGVGGAKFYGVYYDEASGTFEDSRITAVRNTPMDGMQDGEAFFANHAYDVSITQTVTINSNIIDDYQKTGILINELNTHAVITNNTITGAGPVNFIAQNGIQLAFGAYGSVSNNTITGNHYIDPTNTYDASGIILYGIGVDQTGTATGNTTTVSNNTLSGNGAGLLTVGDVDFGYSSNKGLTEGPNTYANNLIHVWLADAGGVGTNPTPNGTNVYDKRVDNTSKTNIVYGQIQKAVNYASAGNTLNASGHTFTEQIEIPKNLTLNGAGASTVILSPATLPLSFTSSATNRPVVYAHDAATVVLNNFTVDGAGKGNANNRFVGIGYFNAGGTVQNTEVKGIRNNPIDGVQGGTSIVAFANNGTARTFNVTNNNIHDFQKNATAFSGANLTVNVNGNTITGAGAVAFIAQNGVQISSGATGAITNNTVSGFAYTGTAPASSAGILVFGASGSVSTSGNTVNDAQVGVYYSNSSGTITANAINYNAANMSGTYWYGIDVENGTVTATKNTINGDGNGAGIEADYVSGDVTNLTATNNFIDKTDEALVVWTDGTGGTATSVINENSITTYTTAAVHNYGTSTANATCNWYGTTDNSVIAPTIIGPVTYIPYLMSGTDNDATTAGFQAVPGSCSGPAELSGSITSQTNVSCNGGNNGSVTVTASGGTPGYQYSIDGGANYGASGTFNGLAANSYSVTVKDGAGITTTVPVTITQPTVLTVLATQVNNACHGGSSGSITATGGGGTPGSGYQYSLGGAVNLAFSSNNVFSNLPQGMYTVTVRDANGCTTSINKTITEPAATTPDGTLTVPVLPDNYLAGFGSNITFVFEVREQNGNAITNALLRITNQSGYTFSLPNITSVTQDGDTYPIDNAHWTATNAGPFYNISLNSNQQIGCGQAKYVAVTITRTTQSRSVFTLTSTLRDVNNELNSQKANNSATLLFVAQ